jgi:hypothetical protein
MGLRYDVSYYSVNGSPWPDYDPNVGPGYLDLVERECRRDRHYARAVCINADGHEIWYGPRGRVHGKLPWE